jgi:hypothetical protein
VRIGHHLTDILEFAALASDELLPGQGGDGRGTERGLGVRIAALDLVAGFDVLPILESWERMYREEWGYAPWGPTSLQRGQGQEHQAMAYLAGTVRFLREHLDKITAHPAVDDFAREIGQCRREAQAAANRQPRQAWSVTCPADTDDGECAQPLRITGEDFGGTVTCRACRTNWPIDRLLMVVATSTEADLWVDIDAACNYTGVPEATLRRWGKEKENQTQGRAVRIQKPHHGGAQRIGHLTKSKQWRYCVVVWTFMSAQPAALARGLSLLRGHHRHAAHHRRGNHCRDRRSAELCAANAAARTWPRLARIR